MRHTFCCFLARPHNKDPALGGDPGAVHDPLDRSESPVPETLQASLPPSMVQVRMRPSLLLLHPGYLLLQSDWFWLRVRECQARGVAD